LTLLPLVANIPINFLVLAIMTLLLLLVLRRAIRQLRRTETQ
jgi:membrane protein implicated in regulation of membrane protease activity